jgi:hypothetical protein
MWILGDPPKLYLDTLETFPPTRLPIQRDPSNARAQPSSHSPIWGIHTFVSSAILDSLLSVDRNSFRQPDHSITIGLLLKWSDGRRLEEVLATKVCRAARLPTPKIISYGERADNASRHSSNPDDMTTGAVNLAKRTNHSARRQKPLLLQSSTLPFGGRQVPEARNEFALSQAVQSAASASQIIHSVLAKRYEFLITAGAQQYLEETECEKR